MKLTDIALSPFFTKKVSRIGNTVSFYPVEGYRVMVNLPKTGERKEVHGVEVNNAQTFILDVGSRSMFFMTEANLPIDIFDNADLANPILVYTDIERD